MTTLADSLEYEREYRWRLAYVFLFLSALSSSSFGLYVLATSIGDIFSCFVVIIMFMIIGISSLTIWNILASCRARLKGWLMLFGLLSVVCSLLASLVLGLRISTSVRIITIFIIGATMSLASGLVIGTITCAAPMINYYRYRVYSLLMISVALACTVSPALLVVMTFVPSYIYIYFLVLGIGLLLLILHCWAVLPEIQLPDTEALPWHVAVETIRHAHPLPSALCLFAAGTVIGSWLTLRTSYVKDVFNDTNKTNFCPYEMERNMYLSVGILCLPTILVPLMIHHLRDWQRCCKVLEPLVCYLIAIVIVIPDLQGILTSDFTKPPGPYWQSKFCQHRLGVKFFAWIIANALLRSLLVGAAYSDLLWQVFVAAGEEGAVIPLGSGVIAITCGSAGAAVSALITVTIPFLWALAFFYMSPVAVGLVVLVMNIWRECRPYSCVGSVEESRRLNT